MTKIKSLTLLLTIILIAGCTSASNSSDGDADHLDKDSTSEGDTFENDTSEDVDSEDGDLDLDTSDKTDSDEELEQDNDPIDGDIDLDITDQSDLDETDTETDSISENDNDNEFIDNDLDGELEEGEIEEELGCIPGEIFCICQSEETCISDEDICRDGECVWCEPGTQYCPCHGDSCDPFLICYEDMCLAESEIDGDEEIVCPGGMDCPCYPDDTCQEDLECRLGTICLEECIPYNFGTYGCPCAGNFCYDVETKCDMDIDICVPKEWLDGDVEN